MVQSKTMGRKQEAAEVRAKRQVVAKVFDEHLAEPRTKRKAVTIFARETHGKYGSRWQARRLAREYFRDPKDGLMSLTDTRKLVKIRQELTEQDAERRANKENEYSTTERARLLLRAKFRSGLDNKQKNAMYDDAGFTKEEKRDISKVGGVATAVIDGGLTIASNAAAGTAIIQDHLLNEIPSSNIAAVGAGLAYGLSFGLVMWEYLQLTIEKGFSGNVWLTGSYALGNKLLPDKTRNRIAIGTPVVADLATKGGILAAIVGITGDLHKATAALVVGASFNGALALGSDVLRRVTKRSNKKIEKQPDSQSHLQP